MRRTLLLLPLLLLACARPPVGAGTSDAELVEVFRALHEPVARVYEVGADRDALHARLASSFGGELLTRQYVEHFAAISRMGREGTSLRVVRVDYEAIQVVERSETTASLDVDWSVGGVVQHQRHRHARTNRYRAIYDLVPNTDGEWRIVETRLRDMERVRRMTVTEEGLPKSAGGLMSPLDLLRAGMGEELEKQENGDGSQSESEPDPRPEPDS